MNDDKKMLKSKSHFFIGLCLVISLLIAYKAGGYYDIAQNSIGIKRDADILSCILNGVVSDNYSLYVPNYVFFVVLLICLAVSSVIFLVFYSGEKAKVDAKDGHEHGKGRISTEKDIVAFQKKFMEKEGNLWFGEGIGLSPDNEKTGRTLNALIIGGTGTGKSFRYVKPNLAQEVGSYVVTDPSGDIFREFAPYLMSKGFNVYLFNISDFALSNHYNPLLNVYDSHGEIIENEVDILVNIYMENANEGQKQGGSDPFWPKSEKAFITGVIYYVLENDDIPIVDKCFSTVLKYVQKARADKDTKEGGTILTREIKEWQARMEAEGRKIKTPLYYDTFLLAPEKTANTILITTAVDLQLFSNDNVDRITRKNIQYPYMNIDITDIGKTQTYLFLCMPQQHDTYNFLLNMLYSQLYSKLYELGEKDFPNKCFIKDDRDLPMFNPFDSEEQAQEFMDEVTVDDIREYEHINNTKIYVLPWRGQVYEKSFVKEPLEEKVAKMKEYRIVKTKKVPELPIFVAFLLDEFKAIGEIPNMLNTLATSRKYRIGTSVIVQGTSQLKEMYPNDTWDEITSNIDTVVFLGSINPKEREFIQQFLGKTTILQRSTSGSSSGQNISYTPTQVDLVSMDEIESINMNGNNKCIIKIRDVNPFIVNKLDFRKMKGFDAIQSARGSIDLRKYFDNYTSTKI